MLLASDLDGTLLNRRHEISSENVEAIERYIRDGGCFVVATGRSKNGFEALRASIPSNTPVILSNGALIYDYIEMRIVDRTPLTGDYLSVCAAILETFPDVALEAHLDERIALVRDGPLSRVHLEAVGVTPLFCNGLHDAPSGWLKALFADEYERLAEIDRWFSSRYGHMYDMVFSHPNLLEMQDKKANKGDALARLAHMLHIDMEHVYCVGDQQNDLSMLKRGKIAFVPENAVPEVRRIAGRVVPDCGSHAVSAVISILETLY